MVSIAELLAGAVVACWALCIFLRGLATELAPARARPTARRPAPPAALEWRKVRRLGSRVLAIRLQVILA